VGEQLVLDTEEDNPVDPNAVRVLRGNGEQLGYLPAYLAKEVAEGNQAGRRYAVFICDLTGGTKTKPARGANLFILVSEPNVSDSEAQKYLESLDDPEVLAFRRKSLRKNSKRGRAVDSLNQPRKGCGSVIVAIAILALAAYFMIPLVLH